jgi:glycosyltransferase involved in cell wall biosynthesis
LNILQINKFLYPFGGAESYMFQLSKALKEQGHNVQFWGMSNDKNIVEDEYNCFAEDINYQTMGLPQKISSSFSTIYSFTNKKRISKILEKFKPDIVHIHNFNFQLTASILPVIKKRNIKIVHTTHDSQLACPYHRLYNFHQNRVCTDCIEGYFTQCIKNRCFDNSVVKSTIGAVESILYHSLGYYDNYLDRIITPSKFLRDIISKRIKVPIKVLPNFIDYTEVDKHTKLDYILYFGRISKEKGIIQIQSIFDELKIPLLIIGDGPEVKNIKQSENISFLGPKYGKELFKYIAEARLVIQPSIWYENCPMTIIESFANSTPVIGSDHSGFKELITSGYNGFLMNFESNNIADQINAIYKTSKNKLYSENAKKTYLENFTKDSHVTTMVDIYKDLIEKD